MRFSLIIATKGRTTEVGAFLAALAQQGTQDFEIIIVDQNGDDRLEPIIAPYQEIYNIVHLHSSICNSSHARNLGIATARGEIIAFPDDDCIYPEILLTRVDTYFASMPGAGVLTGPSRGLNGALGSGRWNMDSGEVNYDTIWISLIEFAMFFNRAALPFAPRFDEELGVGAKFGSGEGADLVLRLMRAGVHVYYDFELFVTHPDKALTPIAVQRAFVYGTGFGRVLRKHAEVIPVLTIGRFFVRPLGGIAISILRGRMLHVKYYLKTLHGRIAGFLVNSDSQTQKASEIKFASD